MELRNLVFSTMWLMVGQALGTVQFYEQSSSLALALSIVTNSSCTDLLFQIQAPTSAGWGAVGVGDQMARAMMFILLPEGSTGAVVSVMSTGGHNMPTALPGANYIIQDSGTQGSNMYANVVCQCCESWSGGSLDITSTKQPWIWAIGPGSSGVSGNRRRASPRANVAIQQHADYGHFLMDMTAARSTSTIIPTVNGTMNNDVQEQPGLVGILVVTHAILLGGSFMILFPIGILGLRWRRGSFKFHWIGQAIATVLCVLGLILAIVFSVIGIEYMAINTYHQIIGILVVTFLFFQMLFGYLHHRNYKKMGHRTVVSHMHIWTGRSVTFLGMLNTILGFVLAESTGGIVGASFATGTIIIILIGASISNKRWKGRWQGNITRTTDSTINEQHGTEDDIPLASYPSSNPRERMNEEQAQGRFIWKPLVDYDPLHQT